LVPALGAKANLATPIPNHQNAAKGSILQKLITSYCHARPLKVAGAAISGGEALAGVLAGRHWRRGATGDSAMLMSRVCGQPPSLWLGMQSN